MTPPPALPEPPGAARSPRWLLRFGYDGVDFAGWSRQPGLRTVEGTLRDGVRRAGIAPTAASARIQVASRTDKGVSARCNALVLTSSLPAPALLGAANGIAADIRFHSAALVDDGFRVRSATWREYHYFEEGGEEKIESYREAGGRFVGRPIDVRSFGRGIPSATAVWRSIDRLDIRTTGQGLRIEVRAPSFVWGMVRKVVTALREVASGVLPLAKLERAIGGESRLSLPLAEPEALLLWEVRHEVPALAFAPRTARHQVDHLTRARVAASARSRVLHALSERWQAGESPAG